MLFSCEEGELKPNSPPDTSIFINKIDLTGEDRLTSVVQLSWIGTDKDGFVKEYQISFDEINWSSTTSTDSTFRFTLSGGSDTTDINFFVRSVDNEDLVDDTPASLSIPIRNTAPEIVLDSDFNPADTSSIIFSLVWNVGDLDGIETIDSTFIRINDGDWFPVSGERNMIRIIPEDTRADGSVNGRVLSGATSSPSFVITSENELSRRINGLVLNGNNTVYVQTRDVAGALSEIDTSETFYLRNQVNDFLMMKVHFDGSTVPTYGTIFNNLGIGYDFIDLFENDAESEIRFWNFNFPLILDQYNTVFWYSSDGNFSSGTPLEDIAVNGLQPFLDGGGKLIMSVALSGDSDTISPIFNFAPIGSITPKDGVVQARYVNGSVGVPQDPVIQYDSIQCTANIANAAPFENKDGSIVIYRAEPLKLNGWEGPDVIGAKVQNGNNQTNLIFFSVELHKFNGLPDGLQSFFNTALNEEFNW